MCCQGQQSGPGTAPGGQTQAQAGEAAPSAECSVTPGKVALAATGDKKLRPPRKAWSACDMLQCPHTEVAREAAGPHARPGMGTAPASAPPRPPFWVLPGPAFGVC